MSRSLLLLLYSVSAILLLAKADTNIFNENSFIRPKDEQTASAFMTEACSDSDCVQMTLKIWSPHFEWVNHTLELVKRWELLLANETCHYYTGSDVEKFAAISFCASSNTSRRVFHGTFFDPGWERYDFMKRKGNNDMYDLSCVLKQSTDTWNRYSVRSLIDDMVVGRVSLIPEQSYVPVLGSTEKPEIELLIGVEESLVAYFNHDREKVIKFVCMNVIGADAVWHLMGIRIKLVGIRFWSDMGFKSEAIDFHDHNHELRRFIFGSKLISGVMDYHARYGSDRIPGTPDATMTMSHLFTAEGHLGVAEKNRSPTFGSSGLMLPIYDSELTRRLDAPDRLHHYVSSITLAHEVGHIMFLDHSPISGECHTDHGECIMAAYEEWSLPFWIKSDMQFINSSLTGTHTFLFEQNCRHADVGTVLRVVRISRKFRVFMWFLTMAAAVDSVWIMLMHKRWVAINEPRRGRSATTIWYEPLPMGPDKQE